MSDMKTLPFKRTIKIKVRDLIVPNTQHFSSSMEVYFDVFYWLKNEALKYATPRHTAGWLYSHLENFCGDFIFSGKSEYGIKCMMQKWFHELVLSQRMYEADKFREAIGLHDLNGELVIPSRHYRWSAIPKVVTREHPTWPIYMSAYDILGELLAVRNEGIGFAKMGWSPNSAHPNAVLINHKGIAPYKDKYGFVVNICLPEDFNKPSGSNWDLKIMSNEGEQLYDFAVRLWKAKIFETSEHLENYRERHGAGVDSMCLKIKAA